MPADSDRAQYVALLAQLGYNIDRVVAQLLLPENAAALRGLQGMPAEYRDRLKPLIDKARGQNGAHAATLGNAVALSRLVATKLDPATIVVQGLNQLVLHDELMSMLLMFLDRMPGIKECKKVDNAIIVELDKAAHHSMTLSELSQLVCTYLYTHDVRVTVEIG